MAEFPNTIQSQYGDLFFIEHVPDAGDQRVWVILLNSGLQSRTGPRRLYVHIARKLAELGYGVVRTDLPGVGDSNGPMPPTHFDLHDPTAVRDVVRYVVETHGPEKVVLAGLCAGARVSIKAASLNPEVDGVVALSMPTFTSSPGSERSPEEPKHRISKTVAAKNVSRLRNIFRNKRLIELSFWRQYMNPKRAIKEVMYIGRSVAYLATSGMRKSHISHFVTLLKKYVEGPRKIAFIFGDRDKIICDEFRELALDVGSDDVAIVPDGTHTFSTYSSHRQVVTEICQWLARNFPSR
jgi:pimeloyl-ACP methyl ester carboxylesterase